MDNVKIEECPVIRPTAKEFENFREFVENLDQVYKKQYGMVRVRLHYSLGSAQTAMFSA
jgi:hypothetical protein